MLIVTQVIILQKKCKIQVWKIKPLKIEAITAKIVVIWEIMEVRLKLEDILEQFLSEGI